MILGKMINCIKCGNPRFLESMSEDPKKQICNYCIEELRQKYEEDYTFPQLEINSKMVDNMNRTKEWEAAKKKLKKIYLEKEITRCEICGLDNFLGFAHDKKRIEYYGTDNLGKFEHTLLLCNECHKRIEYDRKLTKYYFNLLREHSNA